MHGGKTLEGRRKRDPSLMAETSPLKRRREAAPDEEEEEGKRQKPYKDVLSLLEEEEDVPGQDLSSLIASLQQELTSGSGPGPSAASAAKEADAEAPSPSAPPFPSPVGGGGGADERERVMRRLLEASDDELGLPSRESSEVGDGVGVEEGDDGPCGGGGDGQGWIDLCEGLVWELKDEAADHYALLEPGLGSPLEWWVN
ncbi:uncharacterized protein LOC115754519 [Rhodamnia argentea]|uniref:Uncharacterized protein LOC115754519 n=1 Tax=Rhodamnia argentea TaxID=178133 RepID=A0A8B8QSN5_9MYRT|nr:uncharacterized protein LOC115754519 [Rhodamnia argentea]